METEIGRRDRCKANAFHGSNKGAQLVTESGLFRGLHMLQSRIGRQTMERRPQYAILGRVDTELRENTLCLGALEREALQAPRQVDATSDPPKSLTLNGVCSPQLTLQQIAGRRAQDTGEQAQQLRPSFCGRRPPTTPPSHVPGIKQDVPGVANGNFSCRFGCELG